MALRGQENSIPRVTVDGIGKEGVVVRSAQGFNAVIAGAINGIGHDQVRVRTLREIEIIIPIVKYVIGEEGSVTLRVCLYSIILVAIDIVIGDPFRTPVFHQKGGITTAGAVAIKVIGCDAVVLVKTAVQLHTIEPLGAENVIAGDGRTGN